MHTKSDDDLGIDASLLTYQLEAEEIPGLPEIPGLEGSTDTAAHLRAFRKIIRGVLNPETESNPLDTVLTSAPAPRGSKRVTMRVPASVLAKFKKRASLLSVGYQTLMIRELKAAAERSSAG